MTDVDQVDDPVAAVDALVVAADPGLTSPGVESRDVVLVVGPWLAGASGVIAALRDRLPDHTFVESDDLKPVDAPTAVVFVVSAVAPITESDCALIDFAAQHTDVVIGAVSKIDVHRDWRDVLAEDRARLAAHADRYRDMPWVGVAAAPDLGEPNVDELVELLRTRLDDPDTKRRNRLRAWDSRLQAVISRHTSDGSGADRHARVSALKDRREAVLRNRRVIKSERTIALRSQFQQARVQLAYFARNRCTSVRTELQEDAAAMTRRRMPDFEGYVRARVDEVIEEVEAGTTKHLADMATELGLAAPESPPAPSAPRMVPPPLKSRRLETRLMMVLGAGFGLGVALGVSRLFAGLAPGLTIAGLAAGAVVGLLVTVWVVGMRGLLADRTMLDRWVAVVIGLLQATLEERVATRVVAAEAELTAEATRRDEADADETAAAVAKIDAELREHALATARAAALRDRRLPALQKALETVRAELAGERHT
ncbi:hypothetical protein [Mycobacterium sp. 1274761.0]|uniref:hypothetical protein n=1 Tax=Mycobacterium sp. 1274761.0 TaxID=1834077 RepID=UPI000A6C20DC|nr:hypothetical protein [Mycobacterium sp. 1274761.0]